MAEPKVEKTEEQKEIEARKAVKGEKAAKANKKISYPGKGSVGGYYFLKKGDKIPEFMAKDPKYKVAIGAWFE